jgi:hypothetical protein
MLLDRGDRTAVGGQEGLQRSWLSPTSTPTSFHRTTSSFSPQAWLQPLLPVYPAVMGRLVIAHHKSYHPYKRDNIERVKRDEELAELEEQRAEGRIQLADAEARIHLLRERAGVDKDTKRKKRQTVEDEFADAERAAAAPAAQASGLPLSGGHINFFEDLEHVRRSNPPFLHGD